MTDPHLPNGSLPLTRRGFLRAAGLGAAALALPGIALARPGEDDRARLARWVGTLRREGFAGADVPLGAAVARAGELAVGTPYVAHTLEAYLAAGGSPRDEPLVLHLDRFDCVTLVESCLAVARVARGDAPDAWAAFAREVERMRYRGGVRSGYASRLHYFSEWMADGARRGLLRDLGAELGGRPDERPLRFMSEHRGSYAALADEEAYESVVEREKALDAHPRRLVPTERIAAVQGGIRTGDVLAFATSIPGLDVTHTGLAYRDAGGTLRVLHAPLSGGNVEVSRSTLPEYVSAIRRATGILVARPV